MTCRDALIHSISALIFIFAGCSTIDDPGAHETADNPDDPAPDDPDPEDMEPEDAEPESICAERPLDLKVGDAAPSGLSVKEIIARAEAIDAGQVAFFDEVVSGLSLTVYYLDAPFTVIDADGAEEGCAPWTLFRIPVEILVRSEDGRLDDLFAATLVHHSSDPESVELLIDRVDWAELGGNLELPKTIGPEAIDREAFSAFSLGLRLVFGEPRPMAGAGQEVLEAVHGVLLGAGELADVSCPEDQYGGACDGSVEFLVGSVELKGS
jgi:hypothetical protein